MRKFFKTETFGELVRINLVSNGLSKPVGIPIAFFISLLLVMLAADLLGSSEFVLVVSVLINIILLFFIAYFISVRIEQWVVTKFLGKKYNQEVISRAVRSANKASYIFAFIACVSGSAMRNSYQKSPGYRQRANPPLSTETEEVA